MTVVVDGVHRTEQFSMTEKSTYLKLPILEQFAPNVIVNVAIFGSSKRKDGSKVKRTAFGSARLDLKVSTRHHKLNVRVEPSHKSVAPGSAMSTTVTVCDYKEEGVSAEVLLFVVDESILDLAGYSLKDPISTFLRQHVPAIDERFSQSIVSWDYVIIDNYPRFC
jgi:uncharacterized protein YfaS (alpha-2-macroglobulin family)